MSNPGGLVAELRDSNRFLTHELVFPALVMFDLLVKAQTLAAATHQQLSSGQ
jgi:hypothetical protein